MGINALSNQEGRSIDFFKEKLIEAKTKYSTYDVELYVVVWALRH